MNSNIQYFLGKYGMDEYKNCKNITEIQRLIYAWCKIEPDLGAREEHWQRADKELNNISNISDDSLDFFKTMGMKNCYGEIDILNR